MLGLELRCLLGGLAGDLRLGGVLRIRFCLHFCGGALRLRIRFGSACEFGIRLVLGSSQFVKFAVQLILELVELIEGRDVCVLNGPQVF